MTRPSLSACMIVKDGEKFLPACLDSIKDLVDEIIFCIDDRTTDRTAEIAKEYGAKISYYKWEDDFAGARNISLELATCSHILVIDHDEKLEVADHDTIRKAITGEFNSVVFQVLSETSARGISKHNSVRVFRRGIGAHYDGIVHNQIVVEGTRLMPRPPIRLYHYGYNLSPAEMDAKNKRTELLLLKQIEQHPDYLYAYHNLIRVYRLQSRYDDIFKAAQKAFALPYNERNKHLPGLIACDVAFACMRLGKFEKAKEICEGWLDLSGEDLDPHYYMGAVLVGLKDCEGAIEHYLKFLELLEKERREPVYTASTMDTFGCEPEVQNALGCCYAKLERHEEAVAAFQKALELDDCEKHRKNLKNAKTLLESTVKAPSFAGMALPPIKVATGGLNILFVQVLTCIRNYKLAVALKALGHRVSLACNTPLSGTYKLTDDIYDNVFRVTSLQDLWKVVEGGNYDIIHSMNEPDDLTVALVGCGVNVIHGTHDIMSLRHPGNGVAAFMEGVANKRADGRVYTTQLQLDKAAELYGIDREKSIVIPNYVCGAHVPAVEDWKRKLMSMLGNVDDFPIVYQGGITAVGGHHRDYRTLFRQLAEQRPSIYIHVYPVTAASDELREQYRHEGPPGLRIQFHDPVSPADLISEMSQYEAAIIPFNITDENRDFLDTCVGNKIYEYWAARIPVIACDTKGLRQVVESEGGGIVYKTVDDILDNLDKLKEMKIGDEHLHTMESMAPKLVQFYHSLIGRSERPIAVNAPVEAPNVITERPINYHKAQDHDFEEAQWWEPEKLREHQNELLRDMVAHCYENVPFWSREMRKCGIKASDIETVEDLEKLPTVDKQMIRANPMDFLAGNAKDFGGYSSKTGGSTGEPFDYWVSADQHHANYAAIERSWKWAGWTPKSKMMTITGTALGFHVSRETKLDVAKMDEAEWARRILEYDPDGYRGIASPTAEFCRRLSQNAHFANNGDFKRKFVITTSEPLFEPLFHKQRGLIEKWLGPVFDEYGASDGGVSGMECEEHFMLHFASDIAILEDEPHAIVTNLYNYAMPWLRYKLDDVFRRALLGPCKCGRGLELISVEGRSNDILFIENEDWESMVTVQAFAKVIADIPVRRFQLVQDGVAHITVRIDKDPWYGPMHEKKIALWLKEKGYHPDFNYVDDIPFTEAGKTRYVVKEPISLVQSAANEKVLLEAVDAALEQPTSVDFLTGKAKLVAPMSGDSFPEPETTQQAETVSWALLKSAFQSRIWNEEHGRWNRALTLSTNEPDETKHYYYNLCNLYAFSKIPKGDYLSKYMAALAWVRGRVTKYGIGYTHISPKEDNPRDQYTQALLPAVFAESDTKLAVGAFEKYENMYGLNKMHNIQASNHIILSALELSRVTEDASYYAKALSAAAWLTEGCREGAIFAHTRDRSETSFANHCYGVWAMTELYKALEEEDFLEVAWQSMNWWRDHQQEDGSFPFFLPLKEKGLLDLTVYSVHQVGMFLLSAWDINAWSEGAYKEMIQKAINAVAEPDWRHTTPEGCLIYRRSTMERDTVYSYELGWEALGMSLGGL